MERKTATAKHMDDSPIKKNLRPEEEVKQQEKAFSRAVAKVKKDIVKQPQREQMMFSFMPRPMTRISPFFPMSRQEMGNRPYDKIQFKNWWGKIEMWGERLGIFDETILLALLWIAAKNKSNIFDTTRYRICRITGVKPATNTYNAIRDSIRRLKATTIILETKNKDGFELGKNIIEKYILEKGKGKYTIKLDPYFLEMYGKDFTRIDFKFRVSLKGDIAKALYRFLESHKSDKFDYPLTVLCEATNINMNLPIEKKRSRIRTALRELKTKGFLERWTLTKKDKVNGLRAKRSTIV